MLEALKNKLAHYTHGFFSGLISIDFLPVSIFLYIQFILYEYIEEEKTNDEMYHELKEWATGFATGLALRLILWLKSMF